MKLGEAVTAAFQSIAANWLRAALTMLGIVIGVSAVITMVALGTGAQRAVDERIAAMGANLLSVYAGQSYHRGVASASQVSLTTDDAAALSRDGELFTAVVPELGEQRQVKWSNQNANLNVVGTTPEYFEVKGFRVEHGRTFTLGDDEARRRYAVLGASVPRELSTSASALLGRTVTLGGIPFEVVGVAAEKGAEGSRPTTANHRPTRIMKAAQPAVVRD